MDKYLELIEDVDISTPELRQAYGRMLVSAISKDTRIAEEVEAIPTWTAKGKAAMQRSTKRLVIMRNLLAGLVADAEPVAPQMISGARNKLS